MSEPGSEWWPDDDRSGFPDSEYVIGQMEIVIERMEAEINRLQVLLRAAGVREWIITTDRTPTRPIGGPDQ